MKEWQETPWGKIYKEKSVNPFETGKTTLMCTACGTAWKSYNSNVETCPFCGKKYTVVETI